jgi:hypothetical protein
VTVTVGGVAAAESKNAASEWLRNAVSVLNESESPPHGMRSSLTDDFTYEDRRSGPSFPNLDATTFPRFVATTYETGAGRPRTSLPDVLGVRGERFAAVVYHIDYGNGMVRESITVIGLDATLRLAHRFIDFDVDDIDAAIAALDRLHSQSDTR